MGEYHTFSQRERERGGIMVIVARGMKSESRERSV
jgi:hypothetical protein